MKASLTKTVGYCSGTICSDAALVSSGMNLITYSLFCIVFFNAISAWIPTETGWRPPRNMCAPADALQPAAVWMLSGADADRAAACCAVAQRGPSWGFRMATWGQRDGWKHTLGAHLIEYWTSPRDPALQGTATGFYWCAWRLFGAGPPGCFLTYLTRWFLLISWRERQRTVGKVDFHSKVCLFPRYGFLRLGMADADWRGTRLASQS